MFLTFDEIVTHLLLVEMSEAVKRDVKKFTSTQLSSLTKILHPGLTERYDLNNPANPLVDMSSPQYIGTSYDVCSRIVDRIYKTLTS